MGKRENGKRILLIFTGGTIAMKKDVSYSNNKATFVKLLESLDKRIEAKIEVKEIRKIIDSSQLTSSVVNEILELINSFHKE